MVTYDLEPFAFTRPPKIKAEVEMSLLTNLQLVQIAHNYQHNRRQFMVEYCLSKGKHFNPSDYRFE
jgi:hypothetical protein